MTLATGEFIRRFLIHVLPGGFHRIRHCGLFAGGSRIDNIARARELLATPPRPRQPDEDAKSADDEPKTLASPCPCCGGRMIIIETFRRGTTPRYRPSARASRDRDRYVMTKPDNATPQCRSLFRRSSTRHAGARPNYAARLTSSSRSSSFDPLKYLKNRNNQPITHPQANHLCDPSPRRHPTSSPAAAKSP
jgi:hypothetical protein